MSDTVEARVARGAAWLDSVHPGWERRIDLASLDLADGCRCVLGQLATAAVRLPLTGFSAVLDVIEAALAYDFEADYDHSDHWAYAHGFLVGGPDDPAVWAALDDAWIALIKERFATGTLSDEAEA